MAFIAKFAYNNYKDVNTGHILLELNCSYYPQVFFKNEYNTYLKSFSANKLATKQRKLINIYG